MTHISVNKTSYLYDLASALSTVGNGVATRYSNRTVDLKSGITLAGGGYVQGPVTYTLNGTPIVFVGKVDNIIDGAGSTRDTSIGFKGAFNGTSSNLSACFTQIDDNSWITRTKHTTVAAETVVTVQNGDILGIVATNSSVKFYINDVLVATHTTHLPTNALQAGGTCFTSGSIATSSREICLNVLYTGKYY